MLSGNITNPSGQLDEVMNVTDIGKPYVILDHAFLNYQYCVQMPTRPLV